LGRRSKQSRGRDVRGMLLLDKPAGITSNAALQEVKTAFKARKAGHTGSLDPIATGLLPLCFGEATKLSGFLLDADKSYHTLVKLGEATDTGDAEGTVIARREVDFSDADLEQALQAFRGEFDQVPPMYSAVKKDGQPLYKLARQGLEVEREARRVTVYELECERPDPQHLELRMRCSSGFYVRGLAHELGEALGCGGHVEALRRTGVGAFRVEDAVTMEAVRAAGSLAELDAMLLPAEQGLQHLPGITLSADAAFYLCRGQPVRAADLPQAGWVRLYAEQAGFLGVGKVLDDGRVAPKRLFQLV
jgi:tRNA pseudouridine55 synthase